MLNVPGGDSPLNPEPKKAEQLPKPEAPPAEAPKVEAPVRAVVNLEDLGQLAEKVRTAHGEDSQLVEVDGELRVIHPTPVGQTEPQRRPARFDPSSPKTGIILGALIIAGIGFGWSQRDFFLGKDPKKGKYRPATLAEAHKFLSKHSGDPLLNVANQPPKKLASADLPPLQLPDMPNRPGGAPERISHNFSPSGSDGGFTAMPPPLQGQFGAALPDPSSSLTMKQREPADPTPHADLHGLEAQLRTCISGGGGRVTRVREGSNFKTFYVSVSNARAHSLASSIEARLPGNASVTDLSDDDSGSEGLDDVKASEIKAAEAGVISLKKQMDQAEISFLPEAPALKSLRAQYVQALKDLAGLKKQAHPNATLRVTLSAN